MKLKNFKPSNTLKVGLSETFNEYHYIYTEEKNSQFFDDLLLSAILYKINESEEDFVEILSRYFDVKTVEDYLNLECDYILKTLKGRPCIWTYSSDGDNVGFCPDDINELNLDNEFVYYGNFNESKFIKFEEEVSYAGVAIGVLKIII